MNALYKAISVAAYCCFGLFSGLFAQQKTDMLIRAEKTLLMGDTIQALEQFRETLVVYPQSFVAAMRLAEVYNKRKDYHSAIQYCNVALDIIDNYRETTTAQNDSIKSKAKIDRYTSDEADIHHLKGLIRLNQYRKDDAMHEFKAALQLKVDSQKLIDLSLLYLEMGLLQDALKLLHQARSLSPASYKPYFNLANVYNKIQQPDSALYYYRQTELLAPNLKWTYLYAGKIYTQRERYDSAIMQYSKYLSIDSTHEESRFRRAVLLSEQRKWTQAIEDWSTITRQNPENAEAWRNMGLSHFQNAAYDSATAAFTQALELNPEESYTYINRGYSYYLSGNTKSALADLDKGLQGLPQYYLGYYFRALVHLQLKNKKQACQDAGMAVELGMKQDDMDASLLKKCF